MTRHFELTEKEDQRANRFERLHLSHSEAISYVFLVPKNRATIVVRVRCNSCGKSENITEF